MQLVAVKTKTAATATMAATEVRAACVGAR